MNESVSFWSIVNQSTNYCLLVTLVFLWFCQMPEEDAFCVFVKLMQDYRMREIFKPTMAELGLCIFQLESLLQV